MRRIGKIGLVILVVFVLMVGCATHPKDYKGTITNEVARGEIGTNTGYGIVDAVLGALTALPAVGSFLVMMAANDDYHDYKDKSTDLSYSLSDRAAFKRKAKSARELWAQARSEFCVWGAISTLLILNSADCFKAKSEWEGELDKIKGSNIGDPNLIYSWRISRNASLGFGYNFMNLFNDPSFQKGLYLRLGIGF